MSVHITRALPLPEFIAIATLLMSVVSFAIDLTLPALGEIAVEFGVPGNRRQWVVGAFFIGLSAGQLVWGPLSDARGRRPAIFLSLGLFTLGSALRAAASLPSPWCATG